MHKSLIPVAAAVALLGGAVGAFIISSAHAKPVRNPTLIQPDGELLAQATPDGKPAMTKGPLHDRAAMMARMCADHYAHAVGNMAYLETRLALTPAQAPAFERWKGVMLGKSRDRQTACAARQRPDRAAPPSPVDRMTREETRLKERLAALAVERPALTALYAALTPEQKRAFAGRHPMMMGMMGGLRHGMGGMHGIMGGMMGPHRRPGEPSGTPPPSAPG